MSKSLPINMWTVYTRVKMSVCEQFILMSMSLHINIWTIYTRIKKPFWNILYSLDSCQRVIFQHPQRVYDHSKEPSFYMQIVYTLIKE